MRNLLLLAALGFLAASPVFAAPGGGDSFSSVPGPRVDPVKAFQEGVEALKAEDYRTAEKKFGDALSAAPKHPEANYYMGLSKTHLGKDKPSIKYFKKAIEQRDTFVEAREQLALASLRLGEVQEADSQLAAIKGLQSSCTPEKCDQDYLDRLQRAVDEIEAAKRQTIPAPDEGNGASGANQDSGAVSSDKRFSYLLLSPEAGVERYRQAVRFINEAKYQSAIPALNEAAAAIGPHPDILNYLGYVNRKLGRFDAAKTYYKEALALSPNHLGATEYLGELYLELGEIGEAERQLSRLGALCAFACPEREELARLIGVKQSLRSAAAE